MRYSIPCGRGWWTRPRTGRSTGRGPVSHAHPGLVDDHITQVAAARERLGDLSTNLVLAFNDAHFALLLKSEVIGRPLGSTAFITSLEQRLDRTLRPRKPGRPKREA